MFIYKIKWSSEHNLLVPEVNLSAPIVGNPELLICYYFGFPWSNKIKLGSMENTEVDLDFIVWSGIGGPKPLLCPLKNDILPAPPL
jgi:hypothetical protein